MEVKKQVKDALSSTEAEYQVTEAVVQKAIYLWELTKHFVSIKEPTYIEVKISSSTSICVTIHLCTDDRYISEESVGKREVEIHALQILTPS